MPIRQAKAIPIAAILGRLGIQPYQTTSDRLLYCSPVRKQKTPSFWVYTQTNRWYDEGDGRGGHALDLVCAWLMVQREDHTVSDAMRWLKNMQLVPSAFAPSDPETMSVQSPELMLKTNSPIQHLALIHYLQKRGIPLPIAQHQLRELYVRNRSTGKGFFALGLANEEEGYELRNPFFKGTLGTKALTFVRGSQKLPTTLHLFKGLLDYLCALTLSQQPHLQGDAIILHTVDHLRHVAAYVQHYPYRRAYSWLDNDGTGQAATNRFDAFCQTQAQLSHRRMNNLYAGHNDVKDWHMHRLKLTV